MRDAWIAGQVMNQEEDSVSGVTVQLVGSSAGQITDPNGRFKIRVPAGKAIALRFSFVGYKTVQQEFLLQPNETEFIRILLTRGERTELEEVVIEDDRDRRETGLIKPNPKSVIDLPSAVTSVESLIKIFVGSNNELTSNYSVRGGSY